MKTNIVFDMFEPVNDAARGRDLLDALPESLSAERIVALNQSRTDLHSRREYEWNGLRFEVPPGVFLPGHTSRMIYDRLFDGRIEVRGRRYVAMGVGLGVEAVAAGLAGAREIHAVDVHSDSVATAARHFERHVGSSARSPLVPVVADVFEGFPDGARADVITFNPPAVRQPVSDDPDVVRNVCEGTPLLERFFAQLAAREILTPGGEVFVVASTTADLRGIVGHALEHGFVPEIRDLHDWQDGVVTHLFRFVRQAAA
ncbi:release factor glutamine methyltransferase [Actinopolyspora saharensis]|uniref:Release factor glutamine methyltransferase n=2 Tax=Actinopolyspora saharensis TaxID=995062 RepID=A0A1H0YXX4_9ACTN|nr:release factor glutamine methyltransferase [Actinopolyspora saharensis]